MDAHNRPTPDQPGSHTSHSGVLHSPNTNAPTGISLSNRKSVLDQHLKPDIPHPLSERRPRLILMGHNGPVSGPPPIDFRAGE